MNGRVRVLVGAAVGTMLLVGTALPALAADPEPTTTPPVAYCGQGYGQGAGAGGRWGGAVNTLDSVADLLGMDRTQIASERQAGKSLVDIAKAKNVSEDELVNTIIADRKATLDERIKAGTLTQQQADYMLQRMQERVKSSVERTSVGPNRPSDAARQGMGFGGRGARW